MLLHLFLWLTAVAGPSLDASQRAADRGAQLLAEGDLDGASQSLREALSHPDGGIQAETWLLLCDARVGLADRVGALEAAESALTWSRTPEHESEAAERLRWLRDDFGVVTLTAEAWHLRKRVDLELEQTELSTGAREWTARVRHELTEPVDLPHALALPAGTLARIDGQELTIEPGSETTLTVQPPNPVLQRAELQLSPGFGLWLDPAAQAPPLPAVELGIVLPMGVAVAGLRAGATTQALVDSIAGHPTASVELGVQTGQSLRLRGGASGRISRISESALVCTARPGCDEPTTARYQAQTTHHPAAIPGIWLAASAFDHRGSRGFGLGVRGVGEWARNRPGARLLIDLAWDL